MPAALPTILRRIQDQDDAPTLGVGQDGYALTWDNSSSAFVATALAAGVTINDATTTLTEVWSSLKTSNEIGTVNSSLSSHTGDATIHRIINDGSTATTVLWSGNKINSDITTVSGNLTTHTSDATIHRVINDGAATTTVLWSGSKITSELAGKGVGDFLADGTVPMTGDFDLAGNEITSADGDTFHLFGRARIGLASSSDWAAFSHRDVAADTQAALRQRNDGLVYLNAPTGLNITFRNNNVAKAKIDVTDFTLQSVDLDLTSNIISSDDGDTKHIFGRASIGYDGTNSDRAIFAHRDHATSAGAGFAQEADGDTIVNAATTKEIQFKIAGSDVVRIDTTGQVGVGTTAPEALVHVEDSSAGTVTVQADTVALFESSGDIGLQMSAPNNSIFWIHGHTPSGIDLDIRFRSQFSVLDFFLGSTYGYALSQASMDPRVDDSASLGVSGKVYTEVWATDGTINTSDAEKKEAIAPSTLGLDFINKLTPKEWKWKESKSIVNNKVKFKAKTKKRKHHGLVAQDVKAVLDDLNINTRDFAGYIEGKDGGLYLRYHEFMAPAIKAIQELSARVEELEAA